MRASRRRRCGRAQFTAAATLAVLACRTPFAGAGSDEPEPTHGVCATYGRPTSVGKVPDELEELSGRGSPCTARRWSSIRRRA